MKIPVDRIYIREGPSEEEILAAAEALHTRLTLGVLPQLRFTLATDASTVTFRRTFHIRSVEFIPGSRVKLAVNSTSGALIGLYDFSEQNGLFRADL